jgi:uncharacterized membrane protein
VTGLWFFPGTLVSSTSKTDHHDITEILLKVALNTITIISTMFSHIYIFTVDVLVLQRQRVRKVFRHSLQATPQELILKIVSTYGLNSIVHFMVMVFNATFNNISVISWWSVLLVEETRVPGKNHRPVTSH